MFEEGILNEKTKKYIIIAGIIIVISLVLIIVTKFISKKPGEQPFQPPSLPQGITPGSPEEAAIRYLQWQQEGLTGEAEKYLLPSLNLASVEVFGESYSGLRGIAWQSTGEEKGDSPEFQVKKSEIGKEKSEISLEEVTNSKEGSLFFGFRLPEKIIFDVTLVGYKGKWKITKIDSSDLVSREKIGERTEIKTNVFVKISKAESYSIKDMTPPPGFKFFSLKLKYENESNVPFSFQPFNEWKIVDENGKIYSPSSPNLHSTGFITLNPTLRKPILGEGVTIIEIKPGSQEQGYISFVLPENIVLKETFVKNYDKKIIFEFPKPPQPKPPIEE